jgi:Family of unknown function (DUF5694)
MIEVWHWFLFNYIINFKSNFAMKKLFILCTLLVFTQVILHAQASKPKTKVFLLGVFHFDNPGLDLAKTKDTDIFSAKSQKEIQEIVDIIAKTNPQKVFVEGRANYQPKLDSLYKVYLNGGLQKDKGEDVQIGFRLMKQLKLNKAYCVDEDGDFPADSLMKTWELSNQKAYLNEFMALIKKIEVETNHNIEMGMSIKERLYRINTPEYRRWDLGTYSLKSMMKAGKKGNFIGADLASEWYKRNIRIYSNIIRELDGNETSIFVMFGASHQSILAQLFALYPDDFELIDVAAALK